MIILLSRYYMLITCLVLERHWQVEEMMGQIICMKDTRVAKQIFGIRIMYDRNEKNF